jgi:hypothetical protein
MGSLALIGVGCLIVACTAVGLRLLARGARGRRTPELALGASYLLFGALGYPLGAVARASAADGAAGAGSWLAVALAIQNLGIVACYVFNARVFRPGRTGTALAAAGALLLAISWIGHGIEPGWAGARSHGPWYSLGLATRAAAFVWGAAEAFHHRARLARRERLGLADTVVANRMLLWGASYLLIALGFGVFAWGMVSPGGVNAPAVVLPLAACGLGAATAMTLALFPPAFYRRWLAGAGSDAQR